MQDFVLKDAGTHVAAPRVGIEGFRIRAWPVGAGYETASGYGRLSEIRGRSNMNHRQVFRVSVASDDVASFLSACEASEWGALDTGERVMTDEGPDAEAVLLVEPLARAQALQPAALLQ